MTINTLSRTTASGIELAELVYAERLQLPRHAHEHAGFCLVIEGSYIEGYGTRALQCRPDSVTFSPAGAEHRNTFEQQESRCLTIELPQPLLARLDHTFGRTPLRDPFEQHGGMLAMLAHRLLRECRESDDASPLAIEGLVLEMIAAAARAPRDEADTLTSPAIRRVRELLEARYTEPLELADLAQAVDRHPVYVAASFRRAYGETIGDCVRRLRVEHARRELERGALPIAEIALASGFANQSHLTRTFRRATGVTPAAYRRLIADKRS
jgi:AraC family transcriptional regulator